MDLFRALRMLVPPAWQNVETLDADLRAFYEFNSKHMEAWDGPAGLDPRWSSRDLYVGS